MTSVRCSCRYATLSEALNKWHKVPPLVTHKAACLLNVSERSAVAGYHYAPTVLFVPNCTLSPCGEQRRRENCTCLCDVCQNTFVSVRKWLETLFLFYITVSSNIRMSNTQWVRTAAGCVCVCVFGRPAGFVFGPTCVELVLGCRNVLLLSLAFSVPQIMREPPTGDSVSLHRDAPTTNTHTHTHPGCGPMRSLRVLVCERPCVFVW